MNMTILILNVGACIYTVIKIAFFGYLLVFFGTGLIQFPINFGGRKEKKLGFRRNNSVKVWNFGTNDYEAKEFDRIIIFQ